MLWDFLLFRGEILFFQLLVASFGFLEKDIKNINSERIFETVKLIILQNEFKILEELETICHYDLQIISIAKQNNLKL